MSESVSKAVVGAIIVCLLAGSGVAASTAFLSIVPTAWSSWSSHAERIRAEVERGDRVRALAEADAAEAVCPRYYGASGFQRLTSVRHLSWCAKFEGHQDPGMPRR